jgi:hypothetical protein
MDQITWLQKLLQKGKEVEGKIGIFGTSIGATWLAASLGDKVLFFVDEDRNRAGHRHISRPIYDPLSAPAGGLILVPMRADIATAIARRVGDLSYRLVLPPV